jgi:hypothetical protein
LILKAATAGVTPVGDERILSLELESEAEEDVDEIERDNFLFIVTVGRTQFPRRRSAGVRRVIGGKVGAAGRYWVCIRGRRRRIATDYMKDSTARLQGELEYLPREKQAVHRVGEDRAGC